MVRHTLKILQQMLQDFQSVSDHFGTLCIKGLSIAKHFPSDSPKIQQNKWRSLEARWPIIL